MKTETCRHCKGSGKEVTVKSYNRPCYTCLGKGSYETDVPGRRIDLSHAWIKNEGDETYYKGPEHWNYRSLIAYFDGHPVWITERDDEQWIKIGDSFSVPKGKIKQALDEWDAWAEADFLCDDEWSEEEFDKFVENDELWRKNEVKS